MADTKWRGDAPDVAQVNSYTFGGTIEANDIVKITIGGKTKSFTTGSTVVNTVVSTLVTAYNALDSDDYPEFAEMTASASTSTFILTADTPGKPFIAALRPYESDGTTPDADFTIEGSNISTTGTATTASSGRHHFDTAANWSALAVPTSENVYIENSDVSILYGISTGLSSGNLYIASSFTGDIGLPDTNNDGAPYIEYRTKSLTCAGTSCIIGRGPGAGSNRLRLAATYTTMIVENTGPGAEDGIPALLIASGTITTLVARKGYIGIAILASETATVTTLDVGFISNLLGDVVIKGGFGVTNTTIVMAGGDVEWKNSFTTLTQYDGSFALYDTQGAGSTVTTANVEGGTYAHNSVGTITTLNVGTGGHFDASQEIRGFTVTNFDVFSGGKFSDPHKRITATNSFDFNHIDGKITFSDGTEADFGPNIRLTRGTPA